MPYVCEDCGNRDTFSGNESGSCTYYSAVDTDGDGCVMDNQDTDYDNYEMEEVEVESCTECGSGNIINADTDEEADRISKKAKGHETIKELIEK